MAKLNEKAESETVPSVLTNSTDTDDTTSTTRATSTSTNPTSGNFDTSSLTAPTFSGATSSIVSLPPQELPTTASTSDISPSSPQTPQTSPTIVSASKTSSSTAPTANNLPTTASTSMLPSEPSESPAHRLANATVAGVVIAVAIGLALVTFLITFLIMRRPGGKHRNKLSNQHGTFESNGSRQQTQASEPKVPFETPTSSAAAAFENYLPQPADDATVTHNAGTTLDQIELHVENFYQNSSAVPSKKNNADLTLFESPYLAAPLTSLLPKSKNKLHLIKHALAQFVTSSISLTSDPTKSLLPSDFVLLPNAIQSARTSAKPGSAQMISRWRALTSYLRPDPSRDPAYLAERDRRIDDTVLAFSRAFAPWVSPKYSDADRSRSLSALLKDAADLGIWIFAQPSTFEFHWPKHSQADPGPLAVSPALLKMTDESGQELRAAQIMVDWVMQA